MNIWEKTQLEVVNLVLNNFLNTEGHKPILLIVKKELKKEIKSVFENKKIDNLCDSEDDFRYGKCPNKKLYIIVNEEEYIEMNSPKKYDRLILDYTEHYNIYKMSKKLLQDRSGLKVGLVC